MSTAFPAIGGTTDLAFVLGSTAMDAAFGVIKPTSDGAFSSRMYNARSGAAWGVVGGVVGGCVLPKISHEVCKLYDPVKNNFVLPLYNASRSKLGNVEGFLENHTFRSPVTFQFNTARLNSGFPVDIVKTRMPWFKKAELGDGVSVSFPNLRGSNNLLPQYRNSLNPNIQTPCPAEIYYGFSNLSKRQAAVLERLPEVDSFTVIKKSDLNVVDLASLTAKTGDEFAMFTLGSRRLIVRGDQNYIDVTRLIPKLKQEGWTWSAHTHPGTNSASLVVSGMEGDRGILNLMNQEQSLIVNSTGKRSVFGSQPGVQEHLSTKSVRSKNAL